MSISRKVSDGTINSDRISTMKNAPRQHAGITGPTKAPYTRPPDPLQLTVWGTNINIHILYIQREREMQCTYTRIHIHVHLLQVYTYASYMDACMRIHTYLQWYMHTLNVQHTICLPHFPTQCFTQNGWHQQLTLAKTIVITSAMYCTNNISAYKQWPDTPGQC